MGLLIKTALFAAGCLAVAVLAFPGSHHGSAPAACPNPAGARGSTVPPGTIQVVTGRRGIAAQYVCGADGHWHRTKITVRGG